MAFETLLVERRGAVCRVTLNRPERLNALNVRMLQDLRAAAGTIEADRDVRAVVLTGAGRAFCSGADLMGDDLIGASEHSSGDRIRARMLDHFNPMVSGWNGLRVPVVVAVNGVAAGAGVSLALAGDIVLAARSATFLQVFAPKLGLIPDLGSTFHLPRLLGTARAKGLALLGDPLSAADAAAWGMIWASIDDEALDAEAERLARRLADGPTEAFRRIKQMFNREPPGTLDEQLAAEAEAQSALGDTADFAEGLQAFRDKRAAKFTGS
jgi:2-(1,2-epoxy-1,2-dihydrophenyl)acetyl-CoA isomerase